MCSQSIAPELLSDNVHICIMSKLACQHDGRGSCIY